MEKMPSEIGGFSQVEYLAVFITIIFGVVATDYFVGWGAMLRNREKNKPYWLHLGMTVFAFLTLLQNWYGIWPRTYYINHSFVYFFYTTVPMLIFYFITVALFPTEATDYKVYYEKNVKLLFTLLAVYFAFTILSSFVYADKGNVLIQNLIRLAGLLVCSSIVYFNEKKWLQILFLTGGITGVVEFILTIPK